MDREAEAKAIVERARQPRRPTPRWLWVAAIAVALVCVGALVIGYLVGGGAAPARVHAKVPDSGSGFWLGLIVGVGVGIAIGSALAMRRREP